MKFKPTQLALALSVVMLTACGGGGGSSSGGGGESTLIPPSTNTITGIASKGTLIGAIVSAYKVENNKKGVLLHQVRTDAAGQYVLSIDSTYTGPVLLELTVDPNTTMLCDLPAGCINNSVAVAFGKVVKVGLLNPQFTLRSFLASAGVSNVTAITPWTELASAEILRSATINADVVRKQMAAIRALFTQFTMPDLNTTQPADLTNSATFAKASADSQLYSLFNAAFAQMTSGDVSELSTRLLAYEQALKANNGKLFQYASSDSDADMESILTALRQGVLNYPSFNTTGVKAAVITNVDAELAIVKKNGNVLIGGTVTELPVDNDLAKTKAFVSGIKNVLSTVMLTGDQQLQQEIKTRYQALLGLFVATDQQEAALVDMDNALNMATRALMYGVANVNSPIKRHQSLQTILNNVLANNLSVNASVPELAFDLDAKTVSLTEPQLELTVANKKPHTFALSQLSVPFLTDLSQAQTTVSLPWQAAATVDGANAKLVWASTDRGQALLTYSNASLFNDSTMPVSAVLTFKQAQLKAKQTSQLAYQGDITLRLKQSGSSWVTESWDLASSNNVSTVDGAMTASMNISAGASVPSTAALNFVLPNPQQKWGAQVNTASIQASTTNADLMTAGTASAKLDLADRSLSFAPTDNLASSSYLLKDVANGMEVQMTLSGQMRSGVIVLNGKNQATLKVENNAVKVTFSDGSILQL